MQQPTGAIGWPDGHADAWNHVECAMALTACGLARAGPARLRSGWPPPSEPTGLGRSRRPEAWSPTPPPRAIRSAYVAVGVWHELQVTGDEQFAAAMWPVVRRAIGFVLGPARAARRDRLAGASGAGTPATVALLAGCSSIHQSLRCAAALAEHLGEPQPEWELAADQLRHVIACHPEAFADKSRFSINWYYPVLGRPRCAGAAAPRPGWTPAGTSSSSREWACAASATSRGSPAPRPASWCWRWTRWATGRRGDRAVCGHPAPAA